MCITQGYCSNYLIVIFCYMSGHIYQCSMYWFMHMGWGSGYS